jgi:serine/threonine protein phosphatase 1
MSGPLDRLVETVTRRDAEARFYFCGDYVDRGPDVRGVIDRVMKLRREGRAEAVRGNHDDVLDLILNRQSLASGPGGAGGSASQRDVDDAIRLFWREGLIETLWSYDIDLPSAVASGAAATADALAAVPVEHRQFLRELPLVVEEDDFFVIHANWPADYPDRDADGLGLEAWLARDAGLRHEAVWGRYTGRQILSPKTLWERPCYCGHTPAPYYFNDPLVGEQAHAGDRVVRGDRLTLVDTGAFLHNGRLTGICHETGEVVQVHHSGEIL